MARNDLRKFFTVGLKWWAPISPLNGRALHEHMSRPALRVSLRYMSPAVQCKWFHVQMD